MAFFRNGAESLGILLVFTSMTFGMDHVADIVPVLKADDIIIVKDPPNITQNKGTTTGPSRGQ